MNQFYVVSLPDIDLLWDESIIGNDRFGEQASGYQTNKSLCVDDGNVMSIFSEQEKINHIFPHTFKDIRVVKTSEIKNRLET